MKRQMNFRQRQTLTLLVLGIAPLLVVLGTALPLTRNSIIQRTHEQLEIVADLKTQAIEDWLLRGQEVAISTSAEIEHISEEHPFSDSDDRFSFVNHGTQSYIDTVPTVFREVQSVSLLDPEDGEVLLATDRGLIGRIRRNEDYFIYGREELFVSPVSYSVGREAPVLTIALPVHDSQNNLTTVVVIEMNLNDLEKTLASRSGLGKTGRIYLVESYGFYVSLSPEHDDASLMVIAESEGVRRVLDRQNGWDTYADPNGVQVLGVYRWLPDVNMGLLVEIDRSEVIRQYTGIWIIVLLVEALLLIATILIAHRLAHGLVSPLESIAATAHALQAGDFSQRITPDGPLEIQQLALAFNEMATSLQGLYTDLEGEVRQRTSELAETNAQLLEEIRERIRAQQEINALNEDLEERVRNRTAELENSNRELESFAYSVSHDLRTPLRAITGFSQMLVEDYQEVLDDDGQHLLREIAASGKKMSDLIQDMLNLSRVTRASINRTHINMSSLIDDILTELQHADRDRQITASTQPNLVAHADPRLVRIALSNLIGNAWKFTSKTQNARIEVFSTQKDFQTVFAIRDNGAGFDMTYAKKMFGAFQRLHRSDEFEGTGIGLATTQRIIHKHQGDIWAESKIGQGATFYFTLEPHDHKQEKK